MKRIMKTVWSSYLHLFNILSSQVEFSSRVIESSFSTRLECLISTSQFDSTLFQIFFNSTWRDQSTLNERVIHFALKWIILIVVYVLDYLRIQAQWLWYFLWHVDYCFDIMISCFNEDFNSQRWWCEEKFSLKLYRFDSWWYMFHILIQISAIHLNVYVLFCKIIY